MSFFKKLGRSIGSGFKKLGRETQSVFKKGGNTIARGLGSMAGASLGSEIGGAAAALLGPEAIPAGAAVGGLIGRVVGGESASRIEEATRGKFRPPVPKLPSPAPTRLGQDGAGQRRMIADTAKRNELEKMRVQRKEDKRFV